MSEDSGDGFGSVGSASGRSGDAGAGCGGERSGRVDSSRTFLLVRTGEGVLGDVVVLEGFFGDINLDRLRSKSSSSFPGSTGRCVGSLEQPGLFVVEGRGSSSSSLEL